MKKKLTNHKKRTPSQKHWLLRQINDPYVERAKKEGYRSRAAFKLLEIDEQYNIFKPSQKILDLGAAPGGWSEVIARKGCQILAVDILPMDPIQGVRFIQGDFSEVLKDIQENFDGVISDISPSTTGIPKVDHLKLVGMLEDIIAYLPLVLKQGGFFICKVFKGGLQSDLLKELKQKFKTIHHLKPKSSRASSPEEYLVAFDYRGYLENQINSKVNK